MIWWPTEIPTLQYGLVTLRPSEEKDIDSIFNACQDPLIPAFTTVPAAYTIDHAIDFVRSDPFSFAERREFRFVIDYGNGDDVKFAGVISLHTINIKNHTAEIGYWLEKSMRGKGIGTIAAKMITDYGFRTLGFRRIDGLADVDNRLHRNFSQLRATKKKEYCATRSHVMMVGRLIWHSLQRPIRPGHR